MTPQDSNRSYGNAPLPSVLAALNAGQVTGTLSVTSNAASRQFIFVDGELRAARSSAEDEKLGSWLVKAKVITEAFKQVTLLSQEGSDAPPLGHILVSRGAMDSASLENHLQNLALEILTRATADQRIDCEFRDGLRDGQLDTLPKLTTPQLILISARAYPHLEDKRADLGSPEQMVVRCGEIDDLVHEYELDKSEVILLGKLHDERVLFELRAVSSLGDEDFYAAAFALKAARIIELHSVDTAPPPTRPKPPAVREEPAPPAAKPTASASPMSDPPSAFEADATAGDDAEREEILKLAKAAAGMDYYDLLGISHDATYQEIFNSWDGFDERFNPARADDPRFADLRLQLKRVYEHGEEAFEVLSSPDRRPRYDRMIRTPTVGSGATDPSLKTQSASTDMARDKLIQENLKRADQLTEKGDVYTAVKVLERTCDLDPKPQYLLKLARLMLQNPAWTNRAMEKLRRAVEIDPDFVDGWLQVAEFWRSRRSKERQRKALERAIAADHNHAQALALYRDLMGAVELNRFLERVRKSRTGTD